MDIKYEKPAQCEEQNTCLIPPPHPHSLISGSFAQFRCRAFVEGLPNKSLSRANYCL